MANPTYPEWRDEQGLLGLKRAGEVEQSAVVSGQQPAMRDLEPWERLHIEAENLEQRAAGLRQLAALMPRDGLSGSARRYLWVAVAALLK